MDYSFRAESGLSPTRVEETGNSGVIVDPAVACLAMLGPTSKKGLRGLELEYQWDC